MPTALFGEVEHVETIDMGSIVEADVCKAYTSYLLKIDNFPVSNEFDNFEEFEGSTIDENNFYIIERNKKLPTGTSERR
jgi:hypothetical protein